MSITEADHLRPDAAPPRRAASRRDGSSTDGAQADGGRAGGWQANGSASPPEISAWENFLRSPHTVIRLPGRPPMRLATDNVRAKPAVTPQVSMMIGMTAIGLGVWGALFPKSVKRTLGVKAPAAAVVAVFGARELWSGFKLAEDPTRTDVLWTRVGADVFDIIALMGLNRQTNAKRGNARLALGAVLAITALDVVTAVRMSAVKRNCA